MTRFAKEGMGFSCGIRRKLAKEAIGRGGERGEELVAWCKSAVEGGCPDYRRESKGVRVLHEWAVSGKPVGEFVF